jgi:hypothetical protein
MPRCSLSPEGNEFDPHTIDAFFDVVRKPRLWVANALLSTTTSGGRPILCATFRESPAKSQRCVIDAPVLVIGMRAERQEGGKMNAQSVVT